MNFADIQPANLTPEVGWWLIQQGEEWIDKWGNIHRIAQMDDDYIINLHRFLGDKGYGQKLVGELVMVASREHFMRKGEYPRRRPFTRRECDEYFKSTPLWEAVQKRATQARLRKAAPRQARYFDDTQPMNYKQYRRGGFVGRNN